MILRFDPRWTLILFFVALGPLGNLLTPHFFPPSFRFYYFSLPCFPLFFTSLKMRAAKICGLFFPFLIYCWASATIVEKFGQVNEPHTVFRFLLLFCQFLFVLGAASYLKEEVQVKTILKTYLRFYFVSMIIGYLFVFGYYAKIISLSTIARFTVLTQFGFGLLRFSPGSYPNEYGVVSSFVLCVLTLILFEKKIEEFGFSRKWFFSLFFATFLAFLLTTTRAAYLSFFVSMIYIIWKSGRFLKTFSYALITIGSIFGLLLLVKINMFHILITGFSQRFDQGSLGERYWVWQETIQRVQAHNFWGSGFASLTNVHNVYLQLFYELGFVGSILLLGSFFFSSIESFFRYRRPINSLFFSKIRMMGLINVLSFAASNHNLNHHLTWFVCFLCFAFMKLSRIEERFEMQ